MSHSKQRRQHVPSWLVIAALAVALPLGVYGQGGQGRGGRGGGAGAGRGAAPAAGAPAVPGVPPGAGVGGAAAAPAGQGRGGPAAGGGGAGARGQAPVDVTGYWVSVVDEDYIERMFPDSPRSGVPGGRGGGGGGAAGGRGGGRGGAQPGGAGVAADACRAYGAGGSMRLPGRLHITWQDDNTLKVEMDSGTQTRLLRFGGGTPPPSSEKSLQGYSVATWEIGGGGRGGGRGGGGGGAPATRWGSLNVVTTNMTGGYLLTSRSSYTENATLTEYFQRHSDFGIDYMTVVAMIAEPGGNRPNTTSSTFKKEPDGSKFSPSGCTVVR